MTVEQGGAGCQITLQLLSRVYCHLCHDMEVAMAPLCADYRVQLEILDVDADPDLEARWGELVPVLLHEGQELCHYFLDEPRVRDYLSQTAGFR